MITSVLDEFLQITYHDFSSVLHRNQGPDLNCVSISVDDLRRLIEKAGGKFEGNLYSESVTMVASMESAGQVS